MLLFDLICNYVGVLVMNYGLVICCFVGEQVDGIDCDHELEIGISRKETRYWKVGSVFFLQIGHRAPHDRQALSLGDRAPRSLDAQPLGSLRFTRDWD
jgi:hypothetical protein